MTKDDYVLDSVAIDSIDLSHCIIRNSVDEKSPEHLQLVDTVREYGVIEPVVARYIDKDDQKIVSLIDGFRRIIAAREVGIETIPCKILKSCTDDEAYAIQLLANHHRMGNTPREIYKQLTLLTSRGENLSATKLAKLVGVDIMTIYRWLRMDRLDGPIKDLVDRGVIRIGNALELAKISGKARSDWVERAKTMPNREFSFQVREYLANSKTNGIKTLDTKDFVPLPKFLGKTKLFKEIENPRRLLKLLEKIENEEPLEILKEGIRYAFYIDKLSVEERTKQYNESLGDTIRMREEKARTLEQEKIQTIQDQIRDLRKSLGLTEGSE